MRALLAGVLGLFTAWPVITNANVPVTGITSPSLGEVDALVTHYLSEHQIPAASLAIMRNGKIVLQRGYGYVDEQRTTPLPSDALMRVASLTKPITAALIQKLILLGMLSGDTPAFSYLGIRPYNGVLGDSRLNQVTIHDLICHQAGWDDSEAKPAPAWSDIAVAKILDVKSPVNPTDRIRYMLSRPLQHDPVPYPANSSPWVCDGPSWYSNFGYIVLGRVIEKATGMSYIEAVQKIIFLPIFGGLDLVSKNINLGRTFRDQLFPDEVRFYSSGHALSPNVEKPSEFVPSAFGAWKQEYMDSTGGLVASSRALVEFARRYWYFGQPRMRGDNGLSFWKSGGAPGTFAALLWNPWNASSTAKGVNYALILNQSEDAAHPGHGYEELVKKLNDLLVSNRLND